MSAPKDVDPIFKALADSTRRGILDRLAKGPATTGDLIECFPELSRTAVMKHLDLLVAAGLVFLRREGRKRWNHLNAQPIQHIYDRWVAQHVRERSAAMSRLKDHVEAAGRTPAKSRKRNPSTK